MSWLQPELLCAAIVLLAALGAWRGARAMPAVGAILAGVGLALVLLAVAWRFDRGTAASTAFLLGIGLAVGQAASGYRRSDGALGAAGRVICGFLRWSAWIFVLILVGRPATVWSEHTQLQPLLPIIVDDSRSMSLADNPGDADAPPRAERVQSAWTAARAARDDIEEIYDVRLSDLAAPRDSIAGLASERPFSALADALRRAGRLRGQTREPPVAILLVSDGGENVADRTSIASIADELGRQKIAIYAVGVGPGAAPATIALEPLDVPRRITSRQRLRVRVRAVVAGCGEGPIAIDVGWSRAAVDSRTNPAAAGETQIDEVFDLSPPAPGAQRVFARVRLPESCGGTVAVETARIEVRDEGIRVLLMDSGFRNETAFVGRALRGDASINVERVATTLHDAANPLSTYDVVLLGRLPEVDAELHEACNRLAEAVSQEAVGLGFIGGRALMDHTEFRRGPLGPLSPTDWGAKSLRPDARVAVRVTPAGTMHPIFEDVQVETLRGVQRDPVSGVVRLGRPRPAAELLAEDQSGATLLAVKEFGAGRTAITGWETSWVWALTSDAGAEAHARFWRQMVWWLANRRPSAWVLSDAAEYLAPALREGRQRIEIEAGVSVPADEGELTERSWNARLTLELVRPATSQPFNEAASAASAPATPNEAEEIVLRRDGDRWRATLESAVAGAPGMYRLRFSARSDDGDAPLELTAESTFSISEVDRELEPPTSNLALLADAAARTAESGGRFLRIEELPALFADLAAQDRRRTIETTHRRAWDEKWPGTLFGLLLGVLALEWMIRRRNALV